MREEIDPAARALRWGLRGLAFLGGFLKNERACLEDAASGRERCLENGIKIEF